jgi:hypothetical protein
MIDGFGWFAEGDYRRSFLLFDRVDYLFPSKVHGPLWYPESVFQSQEYSARRTTIDLSRAEIQQSVARDLADGAFCALAGRVPPADRDYAQKVVATDSELAWVLDAFPDQRPSVALSLLTSKLLMTAARSGQMPIVGRDYAWQMLMAKLRLEPADSPPTLAPTKIVTAPQQILCSVLAVGLAFGFLDGDALAAAPFQALAGFKEKNQSLLDRHQLSLVEAAQQFDALPSNADLQARIAKLRTEARREQLEIEAEAKEAWLAGGLKLARNAVVAVASSALPLVAFIRHATMAEMMVAALPGAGIALGAALQALDEGRRAGQKPTAYLFSAQELANRHWTKELSSR